MNNLNEDMYEQENDNGELQAKGDKNRMVRNTVMYVVIAFALLATALWAAGSFVSNLMHSGDKKEKQEIESTRTIAEVPDNIGKVPPTLPLDENETPTDTAKDEKLLENNEQTQSETVVTVGEENKDKPPSLKDRRLASNMGDTPQNATPQAAAVAVRLVKNMNLTLIKGTKIPCVLENNIVSEQDGFTSCIVSHDIYSGNAKTLLIEKGSRITGMYSGNVRHGNSRLQIIWDRIITPFDLAIDLNSPSTDRLGASGVTGKVDNRWGLRIGSALLVSLITDTMEVVADRNKKSTVYVESETRDTAQDIAEKVLDQYINLPPIIYIEEGKTIQIYVQQDIDFSNAYRIKKTRFHQ
ncbi:MAG: TrbI/VirB10 family protein [Neisseriaceae bacterium]|nr:TrbI/VirB10 family protein [Neisseriaceae bacterium]